MEIKVCAFSTYKEKLELQTWFLWKMKFVRLSHDRVTFDVDRDQFRMQYCYSSSGDELDCLPVAIWFLRLVFPANKCQKLSVLSFQSVRKYKLSEEASITRFYCLTDSVHSLYYNWWHWSFTITHKRTWLTSVRGRIHWLRHSYWPEYSFSFLVKL